MNWWNLNLDTIEAPELVAASAQAFGAWARACAYCVRLENNGQLRGAGTWTARQWAATCRLEPEEVNAAIEAGLIQISNADARVLFYPHARQQTEQARRIEGSMRGSVSTEAKAEAARLNGKLGGRPRVHFSETQETHQNPRNNPRNNPRETQEKPTCSPLSSENVSETQGKVSKDKGKVSSVGFLDRQGSPPPTDRRNVGLDCAPATPGATTTAKETETDWIARIAREWPKLNIATEIAKAGEKHPTGFDRPWFETHWLPKSHPLISTTTLRTPVASSVKSVEPEPAGWRDQIAETKYGPGGAYEVQTWAELPPHARAYVLKLLQKTACV